MLLGDEEEVVTMTAAGSRNVVALVAARGRGEWHDKSGRVEEEDKVMRQQCSRKWGGRRTTQ